MRAASDPPEDTFRLADYADCLAGLVTLLGLERPHVLGLSFGSGLALELYDRHPEIPCTLILASAYAGWAGSLPSEEVDERLHGVLSDSDRAAGVEDDHSPKPAKASSTRSAKLGSLLAKSGNRGRGGGRSWTARSTASRISWASLLPMRFACR